jgi:hypothetical protein
MSQQSIVGFQNTNDAVICCIAKFEDPYLDEWVRYNLKLGFSRVYIYDNHDLPRIEASFDEAPYKDKVTVIHYPGNTKQMPAYNDFIQNHASKHTWVGFIDCDEFITVVNPEPIVNLLERVCPEGSLALSWRIFGDSGHTDYRPEPVLERFIQCEEQANEHVKCISRCEDLLISASPHYAELKEEKPQRDTLGNRMELGPFNPNPTLEIAYINHYVIKSYGEFIGKRNRGRSDTGGIRDMSDFERHNKNEVEDTRARDFMRGEVNFNT